MPLTTHTVTLQTEYPGGEPLDGIWSTSVHAFPPLARDTLDHNVIAGKDPEATIDGLAVLTLEATGQANLEPDDFRWSISFVSRDRNVRLGPYIFDLTADMTLDEIAESSGEPLTPSILAQVQAAAAQVALDRAAVETAMPILTAGAAMVAADNDFTGSRQRFIKTNDPNVGPELHFHGANGAFGLGVDTAAPIKSRDFVPAMKLLDKAATFTDGVLNSTTTITSVSANFGPEAVGRTVTGAGIPGGTTIASVTSRTTAILSAAATVTGTGRTFTVGAGSGVNDVIYVSHNGYRSASVGIGRLQPSDTYKLQVHARSNELDQGAVKIWANPAQTGDQLAVDSTTTTDAFRVKSTGETRVTATAVEAFKVQTTGLSPTFVVDTTNGRIGLGTATPSFPIDHQAAGAANSGIRLRTESWGGIQVTADGSNPGTVTINTAGRGVPMVVQVGGSNTEVVKFSATGGIGFYGATAVAKQTGVAVTAAAIHAALVSLGLIAA